jgi:hypothetical protein
MRIVQEILEMTTKMTLHKVWKIIIEDQVVRINRNIQERRVVKYYK